MITLCHNGSTATTTLSRPTHLRKGSSDKLIEENDQTDEPGIDAGEPTTPGRLIQDRLAPDDLVALIDCYRSGTSRRKVAEKFGISESTVKYILRKHHVRRS